MIGEKTMRIHLLIATLLTFLFLSVFLSCEKDPTSSKDDETVTDIDGNTYQTIKISYQWWMAENLKVTHYRNGDAINDQWAYGDNESNIDTYGKLYSWHVIKRQPQYSARRMACVK